MLWGIENNIRAQLKDGKLKLAESGLIVPAVFNIDEYASALEFFRLDHDSIRDYRRRNDGTEFPEYSKCFDLMKNARVQILESVAAYWRNVIQKLLA